LLALIAFAAGLGGGPASADGDYQLGHGYDVGPFNFAGYSDVTASVPDQGQKAFALEDLSLFVSGHVTQLFNPFMEAEYSGLDIVRSGNLHGDNGNGSLVLERLYDDADLTDSLTFRFGKMLSPVGEWNQIHAAPLVLTAVRPAATFRNFSEYVTGASLLYSDHDTGIPDLQVYWQPDRELAQRPSNIAFDQYQMVEGFHVAFPLSLLDQVGFSFQKSRDMRGVDESLFGLDFQYTLRKLTLQGEWTYADLSGHSPGQLRQAEWGGYLAASYALTDTWSAYAWYEGFSSRAATSVAHDLLFGVAYRPHPAMVIKIEYLQNIGGQPVNPTGLFASWAVLF
jgi:hypothetical protein